ncbi:putative DNA restriction-modification system, DNA methylase [Corynebacterium vitaeruminis DSM 20294]|uniref:Putative DNA restriction-modification system, DNA methylase n=2 Tax=Corynebacterium vitaeruminis TaxID=38305 RepID=W5Y4V3_9CORY|nr:putative DNA restriction-modification system, DNA methylase [Corynebacterium vitaeruminis DSM 20294]
MGETVVGSQAEKVDGTTYSERADLTPQEDNLLILGESGDVLEALTRVPELKAKYLGKVKCVYIDPPFNTAQTFTNYEDNLEHSVWLTMMRDRLVHLRNLLSDDGSIWVHLDDVENHRMRMLLDEIFGMNYFLAEISWQKRTTRENRAAFSSDHDTILVYGKLNNVEWKMHRNKLLRKEDGCNLDQDPRGPWTSSPFTAQGFRPNQMYSITTPTGVTYLPPEGRCWGSVEDGYKALLRDGRIHFPKNGSGRPRVKSFLNEKDGLVPPTTWLANEVGTNDEAKSHVSSFFTKSDVFATPKPERLLERIIHIATKPGDIVLDVFAGSGTTAAVAQKMGRRWVTCELVEDTFNRFTRPRLEKVIRGEDMGGISTSKGERVDATEDGLPEGMTADEAQKFTSALNKLLKDNDALKKSADVKLLKALSKTAKSPDTVNWRGGGAFTVAKLSPTCFDYDPEVGYTILTPEATGDVLCRSLAAHLGFFLSDENPYFVGKRNRELLCVVEGVLDSRKVDDIMANLPGNHSAVIAATVLDEGVREHVRTFKNGSRVVAVPLDLFPFDYDQEEN